MIGLMSTGACCGGEAKRDHSEHSRAGKRARAGWVNASRCQVLYSLGLSKLQADLLEKGSAVKISLLVPKGSAIETGNVF